MLRSKPTFTLKVLGHALSAAVVIELTLCAQTVMGQVSPSEVVNPDLKALEETYLPQLKAINQSVSKTKFPFPFFLSRFVGLDPSQQAETDSRGLEFVRFRERVILKVSGNYNAAYDSARLTQNERAADTFRSIVLPILKLVTTSLPQNVGCDGIGFEISYHSRVRDRSYEFEGKEILVIVFDRDSAWTLADASTDAERQETLNLSQIFVNGADFGLSLSERDPLNVQALPRSIPAKPDASSSTRSLITSHSALLKAGMSLPALLPSAPAPVSAADPDPVVSSPKPSSPLPTPPATTNDADRLNLKYQSQLAALAREGASKFHFVEYAPPAFIIFRDQLALQMTLRNSLQFGAEKSSIYKRAAQSFDLFLAPELKDLSDRIAGDLQFQWFDFSVLNKLSPNAKGTSEAIEFVCPRTALKQFVNSDITNQQLLDQSFVLVNGVRIALNLQLVE